MIRNSGWNPGKAKQFFHPHFQIVHTSSGIHPVFPFNGHQASQCYEADHITWSSAKNIWIYTTMLQNACMSSSLIKPRSNITFAMVLNCYRMERNYVISYILSMYYDGINFLPNSISTQSENKLLQNALTLNSTSQVLFYCNGTYKWYSHLHCNV